MRIEITEEVNTPDELAELLRRVATSIDGGFTSGYYPHWTITDHQNEHADGDEE